MIVKEPDIAYGIHQWIISLSDYKLTNPYIVDDQLNGIKVQQFKYKFKSSTPTDERTKIVKSLRGRLSKSQALKLISEIQKMRDQWERDF